MKGVFYRVLAWVMQKIATEIICVSAYQASFLKRKKGVSVVPNAHPREFTERLRPAPEASFERKTVLMLSSLKEYKGTKEFIELAQRLPQFKFVLVINDTQKSIDKYNKLIASCDVVVNSCLKEGAVTVSFDFMQYGKPLVCIDSGGFTH